MDTKQFMEHQIIMSDDLTEKEKFDAINTLSEFSVDLAQFILFESVDEDDDSFIGLCEAAGDDDVAAYYKHRNKLKKMTGQTPVDVTGKKIDVKAALAKKKKAADSLKAGVKTTAKPGWGAKIAAKLKTAKLALMKKAAASPKLMKAAKVAAKALN